MTSWLTRLVALAVVVALFSSRSTAGQGPVFRHDSQLLEKLHGARFGEIGTALEDKLSLSAVVRGFEHSRCKVKGANVDAATLMRYMGYWKTQQEQLSMAFTKLHPLWLGTIETVSNRGGCQSEWAQTTLSNLFKLLDQRTSPGFRENPAPAQPIDPLTGRPIYRSVPSSTRVMPFDKAFAIAEWDRKTRGLLDNEIPTEQLKAQVAAIPNDAEVLACYYFVNDSYHRGVLYWLSQKPAALIPLEVTLPKGHPVFAIRPPRLHCPPDMEK